MLQADAIRDSLKALFSEPLLPDNPYYYLASALGAYVDQSALWSESDVNIISSIDVEGVVDIADAASKLCRLSASNCVLGLPHVLRAVSKEGAATFAEHKTKSYAYFRCVLHPTTVTWLAACGSSCAGAQIVFDVLTNSLPDSFFPSSTPFSGSKDGYTIQLLSSVQVGIGFVAANPAQEATALGLFNRS